jgi:hypothetical protein
VTATGDERDAVDEPCDVPLVGQEVVVQGAVPTRTEDGWLIHAWVASADDLYTFPEQALASTGDIETERENGSLGRDSPPSMTSTLSLLTEPRRCSRTVGSRSLSNRWRTEGIGHTGLLWPWAPGRRPCS